MRRRTSRAFVKKLNVFSFELFFSFSFSLFRSALVLIEPLPLPLAFDIGLDTGVFFAADGGGATNVDLGFGLARTTFGSGLPKTCNSELSGS